MKNVAIFITRYALALAFLSAVADRFGLWGAAGDVNVAWGNYSSFLNYTALLNPWAAPAWVPFIGGLATGLEIVFAIALIIGFRIRETSLCSALLLLVFGVNMALTLGIKVPFDYSVFTAFAAALLLFSQSKQ